LSGPLAFPLPQSVAERAAILSFDFSAMVVVSIDVGTVVVVVGQSGVDVRKGQAWICRHNLIWAHPPRWWSRTMCSTLRRWPSIRGLPPEVPGVLTIRTRSGWTRRRVGFLSLTFSGLRFHNSYPNRNRTSWPTRCKECKKCEGHSSHPALQCMASPLYPLQISYKTRTF
jgi:hypothetical protein